MRLAVGACLVLFAGCATPTNSAFDLAARPHDLATAIPADLGLAPRSDLAGGDMSCAPESDAAYCLRLGKSCELVSAGDNCGTPRAVSCGTCPASAPACVANVCRVPVCGSAFSAVGSDVASTNQSLRQDALLGVSASGNSVLYLQATADCVGNGAKLLIGDDATGALAFTNQDLSALPTLATFLKSEESMTLTGDGLTVVGVTTLQQFASSTRSAAGKIDFAQPARSIFDTINASIPTSGTLSWPLLSADLLAFYYRVDNAMNVNANGIYESVRASTSLPFPAGQRMPAAIQSFQAISGMSTDRMTAFMATASYGNAILSRTSLLQPFANPVPAPSPPSSGWRIMPLAGCKRLLGTYEPGGCTHETMRVWTAM